MIAFPDIDPVAFRLGPLAIRWYGLSYIVGIAVGWWLLARRARQQVTEWTAEQVSDLVFYVALGAVLGGRVGYVLFYKFGDYLANPLAIFKVWEGGMSFHGGLLGAILAMLLFARREGKSFFGVSDFLAPVVPVGLFTGRIANFINSELWGAPTDKPWGVVFPHPDAGGIPRHPSQLYEAFLEGLVLFVILWWFSSKPRPPAAVSGLFLAGYGVFRFMVEFVRMPDAHLGYLAFGWLTMGHVLSSPMILIGALLIVSAYLRNSR
jgi:phosphatidylglycerol:prolipoprotein diacylglycerol transferase